MLQIPENYNYIAAFLTFRCNMGCTYCINRVHGHLQHTQILTAQEWARILNRIEQRDIPITFQGGEPTMYPEFYDLIHRLDRSVVLDLLTNLQFDIYEFMRQIPPDRFKRDAPYASIRVSYHPGQHHVTELMNRVSVMLQNGYHIGVWAVDHPARQHEIQVARDFADACGIDFRVKSFLGIYDGKLYGDYKYPAAVEHLGKPELEQSVRICHGSELLFAPDGQVYHCHHDLYAGVDPKQVPFDHKWCAAYGYCNPCDIKIKNNRFQEWGHCSVQITDPKTNREV